MAPGKLWKISTACLLAVCLYLWFAARQPAASDLVFAPLTSDSGVTASPAISADGQLAAYCSDREGNNLDLYLQPIAGGLPFRLTHTAEDESEPAFSPDSGSVAFRSEQAGGGIYVVPARGGEPRLLVPGGHDPRYSPDGKWIAYWDQREAWVIAAAGGAPREIFPEHAAARSPIWSPDGKLVMAMTGADLVTGPVGGAAEPTGVLAHLGGQHPDNINWTAEGLTFVMRSGWVRNIWRMPLDARGRGTGAAARITAGAESAGDLAVSSEGRLLFSTGSQRFPVWALPIEASTGRVTGAPYRLVEGSPTTENPAISEDGGSLLYDAHRFGAQQLILRDLHSGSERMLATSPLGVSWGRFLHGGRIGYRQRTPSGSDAYLLDPATGETRKLASGTHLWGVDAQDEVALVRSNDGVDAVNLKSSGRVPLLLAPAGSTLSGAGFSPDGQWVVFVSGGQIYRARRNGSQQIPQTAWQPVAAGDKPRFSPDGRLIYFTRDAAILAIRPGASEGAFPIWAPREPRLSLRGVNPAALELGIARDKLVVLLAESNFNLWTASRR